MTIQITPNGRVRFVDEDGHEVEYPVEFRPASWPRSARLKFGKSPKKGGGYLYECTVQRKLANLEILKLRGRIFTVRRFQGKVQVGTFVGRRRVVVMDDEEEEDEDYDDAEGEEEYDTDLEEEDDETVGSQRSDNDESDDTYSEWEDE